MKDIRVVLADDHAMVRTSIKRLLSRFPGIQVVGEASNGIEAIQTVTLLEPDILLLDLEMPELNGLEVLGALQASHSPVRTLVLSAYDDKQYVRELLNHGAAGYLTKDEAADSIIEAIHGIANGEDGWFSERIEKQVSRLG
ncbi:MAG: response regulator transcription factor [Anaerolineales bacterium]|jgi:DNA-binding NarL/FixJ family response regulator